MTTATFSYNINAHDELAARLNPVTYTNPQPTKIIDLPTDCDLVLNKDKFACDLQDYQEIPHPQWCNLKIYPIVGVLERWIGLCCDLQDCLPTSGDNTIAIVSERYSSFLALNLYSHFKVVQIHPCVLKSNFESSKYLFRNTRKLHPEANNVIIHWTISSTSIVIIDEWPAACDDLLGSIAIHQPFLLAPKNDQLQSLYYASFALSKVTIHDKDLVLYVPSTYYESFVEHFRYFFAANDTLAYDNLVNLCIMVKNGGEAFREMLCNNLPIIDRWTILDTGSTDNTIDIVNEVLVGKKKGQLYQEPFINFRESRNRCLDLAGATCKFNIMVDDTYSIKGDLRTFLNEVRGDQFCDSFSLLVQSNDTEYYSNRIVKAKNKLRYIYTIHEVIQKDNNVVVVIPPDQAYIHDIRAPYMEDRTMQRKEYDLQCLFDMVKEYPDEPRHLYYIAQTYNLLEKYELAAQYFYKRVFHHEVGFDQERFDALFEMTRLCNYKLNRPWEECEKWYKLLYQMDSQRPEGPYFIGIHYYLEKDYNKAWEWLKLAFNIGYPLHRQYGLKPTLSFYYTPKFIAELAYQNKEFALGLQACTLFLTKNDLTKEFKPGDTYTKKVIEQCLDAEPHILEVMKSWYAIYNLLVDMPTVVSQPLTVPKPIIAFVADGGFSNWSGSSIFKQGVGGSETYIIEMARHMAITQRYEVVVFCRCGTEEICEDVKYVHIERFAATAASTPIEHCFISRYSEYIPVALNGHAKSVYLVVHDLTPSGIIIPTDSKLKRIFCLTQWHQEHFLQKFPMLKHLTHSFHYGIDFTNFLDVNNKVQKKPYSFIYSSFPNRGLSIVLKLWPLIVSLYPTAKLHIYVDMQNTWANTLHTKEMQKIAKLLELYSNDSKLQHTLTNHGWVDKQTLAKRWLESDVWFYPCIFAETFCLTALEAALTKTLVVSNDLAALQNTVGDRGCVIPGDATQDAWQQQALATIIEYLDNRNAPKYEQLIEANFQWALSHSWTQRAAEMLTQHMHEPAETFDDITPYEPVTNTCESNKVGSNILNDVYDNNNSDGDTKQIIDDILDRFVGESDVKILDIGSGDGQKLVYILQRLQQASAIAIDSWKSSNDYQSDEEETFYRNLITAQIAHRVEAIKGDSVDLLIDMIKQSQLYSLIYVHQSHILDYGHQGKLAWNLLRKGGVIAFEADANPQWIDSFLQKYGNALFVLHKGHHVYLLKTL